MNMRNTLSLFACTAFVVLGSWTPTHAYQLGVQVQVNSAIDSIELITGSSRRLKFDYNVPELMVENPEIIQATPVSPSEVLISGLKPGLSTLTISDPNKKLQTIMVHVTIDVRKLENAYLKHFPDSKIKVDALQTGIILSGYVARADQIENVVAVARDFFPTNVINQLQINGGQNIAIKVKVYEVSRTKLRKLGIDWAAFGTDGGIVSSVSDLISAFSITNRTVAASGQNLTFGVIGNNSSFNAFIETLEQRNVAKLLDQPTLVAQNGRPAEFLSGGEIPIQVASGLGSNSIEFRPFGTKLDIVPIVHGQGQLTLEVRAEVSEVAPDLSGGSGVPGFRVRRVNTGVKMKAGHTLALAGDYRERVSSEVKGIPGLMDSPIFGSLFRRVQDEENETELVFLITPRFISEIEPNQVPSLGPGQLTTAPSDHELYINGYIEVPRCQNDCPVNDRFEQIGSRQYFQPQVPSAPEQAAPAEAPAVSTMNAPTDQYRSYMQQPTPAVKTTFRDDMNFSSRRAPASAVRQANAGAGFQWPASPRNR